ncbi:Hermansky-Pudlak syndrome 5 -like protein [Trichinella sp. T8]|nr:Hermansky-Pudlak syndrome 5 -like protein [Trichinella sp. T8]
MDQSSSFASNQPFPSVIIAELSDLSKRIRAENIAAKNFKFLCLSVSNSFLAIGCSTGLVLLFHRFTRKIIKNDDPAEVEILATEASPVVKISLSPNECHLAYGTSDCFVHLLNLKNYTANNIPLFKVKLTDCNQLTTFCWKHDSSELYVGCKSGAVYILTNKINSNEGFVKFFLHLDSSVIQLDECDNLLFISTRHQNLIFNTSNFSLTEFGNWHKRANCGACAWKADLSTSLNVVAARRRGKFCFSLKHPVDNALHFYQPKCVIFCKIIQPNQPFEIWYDEDWRFITFQRLHIFKKKFLISILNRHICIVDFSSLADLIFAYSLGSKEVLSYDISGDDVFLLQTDGTVRKFTIILLNDICNALEKLFASNCFSAAANLTVHFIKQNQKLPCSMNKFKEMLNCVKEDVHGLQIELCKKMFMLKELTSSTNWQIHPNHASTDGNEDLLQYGDLLMIKNSQGSQCSQCGIHGSWIFMMTFGIAAKRVRFANNYFLRGGVPVCADDWKLLFDIRKCTSNKMQPTLCGRCTSLASTVKALFENPNRLLNLMEFYQQNNNQHIDWWSESASSREIVDKSSGSKSKVEQFRWLDGFPIEALLWICVKTVGLESLCQLVDRNDKIERQLPLNWYPLLLLASLNSNAWFLSDRVVALILALLASSLFNLEIAVSKQVTMRTFPVFLRSDSLCPICTLPALNSVSETGQEYVIFACCGSAYHAVCLNGTFENAISEFACLVCRREHSSGVE